MRTRLHRDDDNDYTPVSSLPAGPPPALPAALCRRLCARTSAYTYVYNESAVRLSLSLSISRVSRALVRKVITCVRRRVSGGDEERERKREREKPAESEWKVDGVTERGSKTERDE